MARRKLPAERLSADIETLRGLTREALQERWVDLYGTPCPCRISRRVLIPALAYKMQEEVLGGLDRATRRRLDRLAKDLAAGRSLEGPAPRIKPGTRLLREWQGVVHEVVILEKAVLYRSKEWPSLSAVAREITGSRWSGPRFFGLKAKARAGR